MPMKYLAPFLLLCTAYRKVEAISSPVMARYIIHNTDWVSLATIADEDKIKGYPFVNMKSHADGPKDNSTGNIYLYLTELDIASKNIKVDDRVSVMATLAGTGYCTKRGYDPQDPRCPKVMITGRLVKIDKSSPEYNFAKRALFERHPVMATWPPNHFFFVAKIQMEEIRVMHLLTGMEKVELDNYLSASPDDFNDEEAKATAADNSA